MPATDGRVLNQPGKSISLLSNVRTSTKINCDIDRLLKLMRQNFFVNLRFCMNLVSDQTNE